MHKCATHVVVEISSPKNVVSSKKEPFYAWYDEIKSILEERPNFHWSQLTKKIKKLKKSRKSKNQENQENQKIKKESNQKIKKLNLSMTGCEDKQQ